MKKMLSITLSVCLITLHTTVNAITPISSLPFDKVVLWGHKLHSHTHSYIHWGFKRTFEYLGYKTYWLDNNDRIDHLDLSKSLFITESQVDQNIPIHNDSFYIIHNCKADKYRDLLKRGHCIILQVYTHDVPPRDVEKIDECMYYNVPEQIIYLPWATDLLPHEIDEMKKKITTRSLTEKLNTVNYIGSVGGGEFSNLQPVNQFRKACGENNINFKIITRCSMEDNMKYVQSSALAPALQSPWQCKQGYIPCRIFKNISYGQFGITNSETVYKLLKKKIVYNPDSYKLFYDAQRKLRNLDISELYELMDLVKENHTYINRINTLLTFFEMVYVSKQ